MQEIMCNVSKLKEVEKSFSILNDELMDETKKMQKEVVNLEEILKTPKGEEFNQLFNEFMTNRIDSFSRDYETIKNNFNIAISEYEIFLDEIEKMVKIN